MNEINTVNNESILRRVEDDPPMTIAMIEQLRREYEEDDGPSAIAIEAAEQLRREYEEED